MKVYKLGNEGDVYQWLRAQSTTDQDALDTLVGRPVKDTWGLVRVRLFREVDDFENRQASDCPYLAPGVPTLTAKSLEALRDLVEPHAEVLPLVSEDGQFFALNVTTLAEALDYEHSEVKRFRDGGVMDVKKHAFIPGLVNGLPIFKLPEFSRSRVYVTDSFVERVQRHGLTGFKFNLLWEG